MQEGEERVQANLPSMVDSEERHKVIELFTLLRLTETKNQLLFNQLKKGKEFLENQRKSVFEILDQNQKENEKIILKFALYDTKSV